jgi:tRNA (uracil-5-)-methyltransferase TRM9
VDGSPALLALARRSVAGDFYERDLSRAGCLEGLGHFPAIACLATLQHIPGRINRLQLLRQMGGHLAPAGSLVLSSWQFIDSARQRRKIRPWSAVGVQSDQVEVNDYLLSWQRGGAGLRYVCLIDRQETDRLAQAAGLTISHQFRSDGREGDLNLYTILTT